MTKTIDFNLPLRVTAFAVIAFSSLICLSAVFQFNNITNEKIDMTNAWVMVYEELILGNYEK